MKTKIILAILILLCSCSGVKKTTKSDVKADVKSEIEVKKAADENTNLTTSVNTEKKAVESVKKNTSTEENETEEITIHTINYDSKSKIDSLTKRPAVASEIIQKTIKGKNAKVVESIEMLYSQAEVQSLFNVYFKISKHTSDSIGNLISSLKSEIIEKNKKANNWWLWLLVGAAIPVIIWIALKSSWPSKVFALILNVFKKI